jgi:hypothetical protein
LSSGAALITLLGANVGSIGEVSATAAPLIRKPIKITRLMTNNLVNCTMDNP